MKTIARFIAIALFTSTAVQIASGCAAYPDRQQASIKEVPISPDTGKTADLVLLARVWGYLKYFSPVISERNIDWDKVLIDQLKAMDENPNAGVLPSIRTMLDSAAPSAPSGRKSGAKQLADAKEIEKVNVNHEWIASAKQLGRAEKDRLTALADYFKPFKNKYIITPDVSGYPSPQFKEETYGKDFLPEKHFRLLALFRYWNIIEYYLPAKYQQQGQWPAKLARFIPDFADANTDRAYAQALIRLNAAITDGHSIMPTFAKFPEYVLPGRLIRLPFTMAVIGDTVFVHQTDSGFAELSGMRPGDRVHNINGMPVIRYVDSLRAMMSDPRREMKDYYISVSAMLRMMPASGDTLKVGYESGGQPKTFRVKYGEEDVARYLAIGARAWAKQQEAQKQEVPPPGMRMLEGDILYIDPAKWSGKMADTTRELLTKAKSLIIECRTYPNFDFINFTHFLFKKQTECILWNGTISYPGLTKTVEYKRGPDRKVHFKGKVVVLIAEKSVSRPEMLTMIVKARKGNTVLIGRTTGGADGDVTQIPMVGNQEMRFVISGLGVLYPDGGYTQGIGIVPDVEVPLTVAEFTGGKDVIYQRALQYLAANP